MLWAPKIVGNKEENKIAKKAKGIVGVGKAHSSPLRRSSFRTSCQTSICKSVMVLFMETYLTIYRLEADLCPSLASTAAVSACISGSRQGLVLKGLAQQCEMCT